MPAAAAGGTRQEHARLNAHHHVHSEFLARQLETEGPVGHAALDSIQYQLNQMPHVNREPAFPDQATRLLLSEAHSD